MKDMKRAVRRHHVARLKNKRKYYWGYQTKTILIGRLRPQDWNSSEYKMPADQLGKVLRTPAICSCPGCANSRKYLGLTLAEKSFLELCRSLDSEDESD